MSTLSISNEEAVEADKPGHTLAFEITALDIERGERRGTSFRVNSMLHRWLKAYAALEDRQEGDLVNEAIANLLVKYKVLSIK